MLKPEDQRIAAELRRRLAFALSVLDLRVFGSRGGGGIAPESDLDLFIVVEAFTPELRRKIDEIAWEVGVEADRVISTVVATPEQVERDALGASPLILNIEREGVPV